MAESLKKDAVGPADYYRWTESNRQGGGKVKLLRSDSQDIDILLGEPKRAVRSMFTPFLVAFAIIEANQFIDTFWISGLGTSSASAISTIIPFYVLLMCAGIGISVGATTSVAS